MFIALLTTYWLLADKRKLEKLNFILVCFDDETKYILLKAEKMKFEYGLQNQGVIGKLFERMWCFILFSQW